MGTNRLSILSAILLFVAGYQFIACSTPGPGLFAKRTPHDQYGQKLSDAGLGSSALGTRWFLAADQGLHAPLPVTLPYRESGFFAADRPSATGIRFAVKRGEKITVSLEKTPAAGFALFCDVWQVSADAGKPKLVASFDTTGQPLGLEIKDNGEYIVRLQPELLKSGQYTLSISTGPSLAFPLPSSVKPRIGSFWGANRDAGARSHEGIDIFAPKHSAAIAAADGVVTSVTENRLGGKVVFLRPDHRNYALYYAHLDSQLVSTGQSVRTGDTLGLTGNTGNARFTPSHLHFGIYAAGGAVDPLPFVNPVIKEPGKVTASLASLGVDQRSGPKSRLFPAPDLKAPQSLVLEPNALVWVQAATDSWYKVELPGGQQGFVSARELQSLGTPVRRLTLRSEAPLLDQPDSSAPRKLLLPKGRAVEVLATHSGFYYVEAADSLRGWMPKGILP